MRRSPACAKTQDPPQLLADRKSLLRRKNHAAMFSARTDPSRVKSIEIGDVEGVEDTLSLGRERQVFLVGPPDQAGIQRCDHFDTPRSKRRNQITIHSVFIDVDSQGIHALRSTPVLLLYGLCFPRLCFQVAVDFRLVGVVVGKGRMNLSQRKMAELPSDLFRNQAHVVPLSDPTNGNSCPGNARPPAANVRSPGDQAADLGYGSHYFKYIGFTNPGNVFYRKPVQISSPLSLHPREARISLV